MNKEEKRIDSLENMIKYLVAKHMNRHAPLPFVEDMIHVVKLYELGKEMDKFGWGPKLDEGFKDRIKSN